MYRTRIKTVLVKIVQIPCIERFILFRIALFRFDSQATSAKLKEVQFKMRRFQASLI